MIFTETLAQTKKVFIFMMSMLSILLMNLLLGPVKVIKVIFFLVVQKAVKPIIIQKLLCYWVY